MAKRISELPTAVNADGMMLTGTQGTITKQIPAYKVGGEVWDDVTNEFTGERPDALSFIMYSRDEIVPGIYRLYCTHLHLYVYSGNDSYFLYNKSIFLITEC